jgi:hypothetical protein
LRVDSVGDDFPYIHCRDRRIHLAAAKGGFDVIDYLRAAEVYVGCAFAEWMTV